MTVSHLFLHAHDDKFMEECDIVSGVVSVPDGQEDEDAQLGVGPVVQELEPLVNVVGNPGICVDVERLNQLQKMKKKTTRLKKIVLSMFSE